VRWQRSVRLDGRWTLRKRWLGLWTGGAGCHDNGRLDRRINGRINGRLDRWFDGWINRRLDGRLHRQRPVRVDGRRTLRERRLGLWTGAGWHINGRLDRRIDRRIDGRIYRRINRWFDGWLDRRLHGRLRRQRPVRGAGRRTLRERRLAIRTGAQHRRVHRRRPVRGVGWRTLRERRLVIWPSTWR
jgi:hypothetical protein